VTDIWAGLAAPPPAPALLLAAFLVDLVIPRASAKPDDRALAPFAALRRRLDRPGRSERALKVRGGLVAGLAVVVLGAGGAALGRALATLPYGWTAELLVVAALLGMRAPLDAARRAIEALGSGAHGSQTQPLTRIALDRLGARFVEGPAASVFWFVALGLGGFGLGGLGLAAAARLAGALAAGAPEAPFSRGLLGVGRWVLAPAGWLGGLALAPAALAAPGGRPLGALRGALGRPVGPLAGARALAGALGRPSDAAVEPSDLKRGALVYGLGCLVLGAFAALSLPLALGR
jgi:hypothetical protein